jgi:hypothetical protein
MIDINSEEFREEVENLTPGQQGIIADLIEAGAEMTRQAFAQVRLR